MSVGSTVISDLKSFAARVGAEFKRMFHEAPSWLSIAQGVLTYLGPIVVTIADVAGGAALGAEASTILGDIKTKLATAAALATTVENALSLTGVLKDVQSDLPTLLAALEVSNPSTVAEVTSYTDLIGTELTALVGAIPSSASTSAVAA